MVPSTSMLYIPIVEVVVVVVRRKSKEGDRLAITKLSDDLFCDSQPRSGSGSKRRWFRCKAIPRWFDVWLF